MVLTEVPKKGRSLLLRRLFHSFLNDPEFPPGTPRYSVYLVLMLIATGTFILLTSFSSIRYGGFSVLSVVGVAFLVRGVAEFLPVQWRGVCVFLRVMGLLTAVLALWLLVQAT
jgi:hypothetical protein